MKQLRTVPGLKGGDCSARGRLREVQGSRSPGDVLFFGDRHENPELFERHDANLFSRFGLRSSDETRATLPGSKHGYVDAATSQGGATEMLPRSLRPPSRQ